MGSRPPPRGMLWWLPGSVVHSQHAVLACCGLRCGVWVASGGWGCLGSVGIMVGIRAGLDHEQQGHWWPDRQAGA